MRSLCLRAPRRPPRPHLAAAGSGIAAERLRIARCDLLKSSKC
ncbi:hypothetical protein [Lysobacter gummosus]